ncbi:MAG TPA: 6-pyruvoyl-tetrahydropterin synthase-related protein, partial [Patescibacteria group bacterium]|nr:6-pyruvoyl-tetrahydropterin synthase-related protein [Patescibacteria group bacterium]
MKTRGIILITFLSILPLLGLIHPGLPVTHDGQDHVARIANFFLSLTEGNLVPRWAENLNWGYGHPIMMFLYPLPSYMASIFHLFGLGFVDSTKIVFAVSFIFSGIFMYLWLSEFLGEIPAISGAILYNFAPYRFVDLYVRGAIGEHVAFIFPPLVAYFILKLSKKNKRHKWYIVGLALSTACLILAHNAMSLMFLPFLFVYAIYLFLLNRNFVFLGKSIGGIALGFLLSAFFWIPAFLEGRYTLRDIVVGDEVFKRFVDVPSLIYGPWSYGITGQFSVQVGILQWVAFLFSIPILFIAYKKNKNIFILLCITLIYFLGSLFIMLPVSTFVWKSISIIQKFQFPWRFLSISVFSIAIIGAVVMDYIPKKLQSILLILMLAFLAIFNRDYWLP